MRILLNSLNCVPNSCFCSLKKNGGDIPKIDKRIEISKTRVVRLKVSKIMRRNLKVGRRFPVILNCSSTQKSVMIEYRIESTSFKLIKLFISEKKVHNA